MKPGYKQTEVGVIPEDWELKTLKQAAETSSGINKPLSEMGSGVLYVTVQDLYDGTSIPTNRLGRVQVSPDELARKCLVVGDIVFAKSSVKREGIGYPSQFLGCEEPVVFSGFTYRARARRGIADAAFLFYSLRTEDTRRWLINSSQASALTNINQRIADAIPIKLPSTIPEQRAIAEPLSDVDSLLQELDRLIAKKGDLKQATMQQLMTGQTRLPGFHGKWQMKHLRDVANTDPEQLGLHTRKDFAFSYIAIEDVERGVLRSHSEQIFAEAPSRARRKLRGNDVLVSTVRPNLQSHLLFKGCDGDWVCSTGFCVVRCREAIAYPPFVFGQMFTEGVIRQIDALLAGSNYPAISSDNVASLTILFPCIDEQIAIAAVLSDMDAEIAALEARRNKTRDLKQAMMQELLTGKTRLVPPEVAHA